MEKERRWKSESLSLCVLSRNSPRDDAICETTRGWRTRRTLDAKRNPLDTFFAPGKGTVTRMIFQNTKQETSRVPPRTRESYNCFEQKSIDDDDDDDAFCLRWIQTPPPPPPPTRGNEDECLFWGLTATTFKLSKKRRPHGIHKQINSRGCCRDTRRTGMNGIELNHIIMINKCTGSNK